MSTTAFDTAHKHLEEIKAAQPDTAEALEAFRIKYLGSKNILKPLFGEIKTVAPERKREYGQLMNELKKTAEAKLADVKASLEATDRQAANEGLDLTRPGTPTPIGSRHPIAVVTNKVVSIFERIGFQVVEEREIEDDLHNFTMLNTPEDHPARDMQDTFYLMNDPELLLRTHTSSVQARIMERAVKGKQEDGTIEPIRILAPGRVYRNETISARSHAQFHQVEGLYIDENVSFADLKQTIYYYAKEMYGATKIRMRPSYFPFTEPSAEVDVWWGLETEHDHKITKGTGWLEILGCGMVDPNVLDRCGIDADRYSGFAFGMGIERQAMLEFGIPDIRLFFENDVRFLKQFAGV